MRQAVNNIGIIRTINPGSASDGSINSATLSFDPASYHFYTPMGVDVTDALYRADKLKLVNSFDQSRENERIYGANYPASHGGQAAPPPPDPSLWHAFTNNVTKEVTSITTLGTGSASGGLQKIVIWGVGLMIGYMLLKAILVRKVDDI